VKATRWLYVHACGEKYYRSEAEKGFLGYEDRVRRAKRERRAIRGETIEVPAWRQRDLVGMRQMTQQAKAIAKEKEMDDLENLVDPATTEGDCAECVPFERRDEVYAVIAYGKPPCLTWDSDVLVTCVFLSNNNAADPLPVNKLLPIQSTSTSLAVPSSSSIE
jgi:hypothetical protein